MVKISYPKSTVFSIKPYSRPHLESNSGNKVASGMDIAWIVRFNPDAKQDYSFEITVHTEREKFILAVTC